MQAPAAGAPLLLPRGDGGDHNDGQWAREAGGGGVVGGVEEAVAHRGAGHLPADRAVRDQRRLASLHRPPRRPRARRLLHRRHRRRRLQLRIPGTPLATSFLRRQHAQRTLPCTLIRRESVLAQFQHF